MIASLHYSVYCGGLELNLNIFEACLYFLGCGIYIYIYIVFFRAAPAAYGCSQSRDRIGAVAACLCHNHGS